MLSDEWLPRYRLLENFNIKWNGNAHGNGNGYDRGDYNSSFALRAVELKSYERKCRKQEFISGPLAYKSDTLPIELLSTVGWLRIELY